MNTKKFSNALGNISESYVDEAVTYTAKKKSPPWVKWVAVAACLCFAVMGLFPLFGNHESPFVLTAYAIGKDNSLLSLEMEEGRTVPISTFVAGNGMEGFVFSHKNHESEKAPLVSIINTDFSPYIMTDSYTSTTAVEKIEHIDMEKTQQYIFFVPSKGESAPYSLTISIYDEETSKAANLTIVIEPNENGYSAKIDKINSYEIIGDIDELLKPYQEVLDRLNAEYDYKLYIPEDRKYSVYDAYKDLSPEEFEKQILEELNDSTEDFEGNGEMNFDVVYSSSDFFEFNRNGITEVTGTSQMSDPVVNVVLPKSSVEKLLNQVEELCLLPTDDDDNKKGWEYLFVVKYDDGSTTSVSLSEEKIKIDEKVYETDLYQSNDFSVYFE